MSQMGNHTALNGGHRGEDGAIAAAPVIAPLDMSALSLPRGPVTHLPQPAADVRPEPRARFDGDRLRRGSMWVLASGVAAIAAIVSYSHIYDLGRAHGGTGTAARLLPLSVDMLIVVGELMLLHEADVKGRRFPLGWVLVWSGILATLAANVTYGAQYGIVGALIWGWPAYSFILAAGGMVAVVKRTSAREDVPDSDGDLAAAPVVKQPDKTADKATDKPADKPQVKRPVKRTLSKQDKAAAMLRDNPALSVEEVARRVKCDLRTVRRAKAAPKGPEE